MRELRLTRKAAADLSDIADFTIAEFGIEQAGRYRDQFARCFASLLDNPFLGRSANELAPGLRRIRQQAHVVFYQPSEEVILVVRVLHHRMDFEQHLSSAVSRSLPIAPDLIRGRASFRAAEGA